MVLMYENIKNQGIHSDAGFFKLLSQYVSHPCFSDGILFPESPYDRPIRKQDFALEDFSIPITVDELNSNKNLLINKLLLTIYEQDLLFLGTNFNDQVTDKKFYEFYNSNFVALGKLLKPKLEYLAFSFLDKEIEIIGFWTKNKLLDYLDKIIKDQEKENNKLCCFIESSTNHERALKMLLIQMAPDFLTEASAMARLLPGSFGEEQSELMKIFIDEYGYGVHRTKHSTLFENTLESVNMNKEIHYYYNSYLPTSFMLVNYFHYLCSNKANWFKYLGSLYYTEASIPHFNKQISVLLKKYLGCKTKTAYFDEHVHIDVHHRRMVFDKLIVKTIENYGEKINNDILFGFQSFNFLQDIADQDLIKQIKFDEQKQPNINYLHTVGETKTFEEINDETTISHIHSEDELFTIKNGTIEFHINGIEPRVLQTNEKIIIPKGRLHSTRIISSEASYTTQPVLYMANGL